MSGRTGGRPLTSPSRPAIEPCGRSRSRGFSPRNSLSGLLAFRPSRGASDPRFGGLNHRSARTSTPSRAPRVPRATGTFDPTTHLWLPTGALRSGGLPGTSLPHSHSRDADLYAPGGKKFWRSDLDRGFFPEERFPPWENGGYRRAQIPVTATFAAFSETAERRRGMRGFCQRVLEKWETGPFGHLAPAPESPPSAPRWARGGGGGSSGIPTARLRRTFLRGTA